MDFQKSKGYGAQSRNASSFSGVTSTWQTRQLRSDDDRLSAGQRSV